MHPDTEMTTTTIERVPLNGVDTSTLFATLDAVKAHPRSPSSSSREDRG